MTLLGTIRFAVFALAAMLATAACTSDPSPAGGADGKDSEAAAGDSAIDDTVAGNGGGGTIPNPSGY